MKLLLPAPRNEMHDTAKLVDTADAILPLDQLECSADQYFTDPERELYFEYRAPEGRAIRVTGNFRGGESNEAEDGAGVDTREFVGYALAYAVRNLNRGGSAHKQNDEHEAPQGKTYRYVNGHVSSRRVGDLPRPGVEVTVIGRVTAIPSKDLGEYRKFETAGKSFGYHDYVDMYQMSVDGVSGDLTDIEVEVIDDPNPAQIVESDSRFTDMFKDKLWLPQGEAPSTAEAQVERLIKSGELDLNDREAIDRTKEFLWRLMRSERGLALKDDPYPEAARLRFASTIDKDGNNARLYSPYEGKGLHTGSDRGHIFHPNGEKISIAIMDREELLRRLAINAAFRRTGWNVHGGRQ